MRHVCLETVNSAVRTELLSTENAVSVKTGLLDYTRHNYNGSQPAPDSAGMQNKLAQTLTFLFAALYASGWEHFFHDFRHLAEEDMKQGGQGNPGMMFYFRVLNSIHDEIADQMIQTTAERAKANMTLKDLVRERDIQQISASWQEILSRWQKLDYTVGEYCLRVIGKWISWTEIHLVANEGMLQHFFAIAGQQDTGHPDSPLSKARDAAIGVFTELVAKKMSAVSKVELLQFLKVDAVVATLVAVPTLQNASTPDYDTDMAESVAKLVNNVILELVAVLNEGGLSPDIRKNTDDLLQSFTPYLLRFLSDEYDEVCSTVMPALSEELTFFRKTAKASKGLPSPYKEMLPPILHALVAKMRYDDTATWGEEDEETDEAEFQELRKRLKVAQQTVAAIDEGLYMNILSEVVTSTFHRCQQEGNQLNWRDLDVALLEMYMLGELATRNSGLNQKRAPTTADSQRLMSLMSLMIESNVPSFPHPTAQLHVMEICVRFHSFFEQAPLHLPKVLEDFVRFAHSNNVKVRHRAWHLFLRFTRTERVKLGDLAEGIIRSISDLLTIRAVVPSNDDADDSSSSNQGPLDSTFQSQLFLFEAFGTLASVPSLSADQKISLVRLAVDPLIDGMKEYGDAAARGDEKASYQTHHYVEATGTLARGFSDWVPGKTASPVSEEVAAEFRKASEVILSILGGLKHSYMIREAARFAFSRLVGVIGYTLLEQLPRWIDGLLSSGSSREEMANFLRLLAQVIFSFKEQIYPALDGLLSILLERIFAGFSQPTEGTDDALELGDLRREYLNFLNVLLTNNLEGVLVSTANQPSFDTIIATLEHFSRDTQEPLDARSAIMILNRMSEMWGGRDVFNPSPDSDITNSSPPAPTLPGFDQFMIDRFSTLTWSVMTNPSFHPREPTASRIVGEIATLQQTILSKTGLAYVTALQQKQLPDMSLQPLVIEQYLQNITTLDRNRFKQWLAKFLQQGPAG